jgi:glutamyl-tRNA reductase
MIHIISKFTTKMLILQANSEMQAQYKYIGASYQKADLALRESISLNEQECKELILSIKEMCGCTEILAISTCNRTGFYYNHTENIADAIIQLLGMKKGIANLTQKKDSFLEINTHKEAVQHLFNVSMGLDSQVIGDLQISNQFKKAYQLSADNDLCGPFTHRLLHSVFFTNKRVAQETSYRDGTASVSYAAVELIDDFASNFKEPKVLVVGLGEMGIDVAKNLKNYESIKVSLSNRTKETAQVLADELNYQVIDFEEVKNEIHNFDIILGATNSPEPFLKKEDLKKAKFGLKYFIDLSVPRSIDPEISKIPGTLVYNIDNIKNQTEETLKKRIASIPQVEKIIAEAMEDFENWEQELEVSPTIHKLKNALEDIRKEEVARYLKNLDDSSLEVIENITKGMMQKIIKLPVMQLKAACKRGDAETLIDVLNDLFNLEKESFITK